MDWAMMAAKELTDSYWDGRKGDHISVSQSELVAALRKAKADGMREAALRFNGNSFAEIVTTQSRMLFEADKIEKGNA